MIGPTQRPVPDNPQQSLETKFHALGGIRTGNPSNQSTSDPRLRPRGQWDRRNKAQHPQLSFRKRTFIIV